MSGRQKGSSRKTDKSTPRKGKVETPTVQRLEESSRVIQSEFLPTMELPNLKRYILEPPKNLLPLNKHHKPDLVFPGFYPFDENAPENKLSATKIRNGSFDRYDFKDEVTFASDDPYNYVYNSKKFHEMGIFMTELLKKKKQDYFDWRVGLPKVEKEGMKEKEMLEWLANCCNLSIPIKDLPLVVPHGLRIEVLVKKLIENKAPISRALWLLKILILSDYQMARTAEGDTGDPKTRNETSSTVLKFISDWTNIFIRLLERFIGEILKFSTTDNSENPNPGELIHYLNYSMKLAECLYVQDLLDQKQFLKWLSDSIFANINKCSLLFPLLLPLLPEFCRVRALSVMLIRSLASHHERVITNPDSGLNKTSFIAFCRGILRAMMFKMPDVFFNPRMFHSENIDWKRIVTSPSTSDLNVVYTALEINFEESELLAAFASIQERNEKFYVDPFIKYLNQPEPSAPRAKSGNGDLTSPFKGFGKIDVSTDLGEVASFVFKNALKLSSQRLFSIVDELIRWAIANMDSEPELKYVTCRVIKLWAGARYETSDATPNTSAAYNLIAANLTFQSNRKRMMNDALFQFISDFDPMPGIGGEGGSEKSYFRAHDEGEPVQFTPSTINHIELDAMSKVTEIYSQLIFQGTFSYAQYLTRSKHKRYLDFESENSVANKRHTFYLRSLPAYGDCNSSLEKQRVEYLASSPYTFPTFLPDKELEDFEFAYEMLARNLDEIFRFESYKTPRPSNQSYSLVSPSNLARLRASSPYVKGEVVKKVLSGTTTFVKKVEKTSESLLNPREFVFIVSLLEALGELGALCEISIWVMTKSLNRGVIQQIVDVFDYHKATILSLGFSATIFAAMLEKHRQLVKLYNYSDKYLAISLLKQIAGNVSGSDSSIKAELEDYIKSLFKPDPTNNLISDVPETLIELDNLPSNPEKLYRTALAIHSKYRNVNGWWEKVFISSLTILQSHFGSATDSDFTADMKYIRNMASLFRFLFDFVSNTSTLIIRKMCTILMESGEYAATSTQTRIREWSLLYVVLLSQKSQCPLNLIVKECVRLLNPCVNELLQKNSCVPITDKNTVLLLQNVLYLLRLVLLELKGEDNEQEFSFTLQDCLGFKVARKVHMGSVDKIDSVFKLLYQLTVLETIIDLSDPIHSAVATFKSDLSQEPWLLDISQHNITLVYQNYVTDSFLRLRSDSASNQEPLLLPRLIVAKLLELFLSVLDITALVGDCSTFFTHLLQVEKLSLEPAYPPIYDFSDKNRRLGLIGTRFYFDLISYRENFSLDDNDIQKFVHLFFHVWVKEPTFPLPLLALVIKSIPLYFWPNFIKQANLILTYNQSVDHSSLAGFLAESNRYFCCDSISSTALSERFYSVLSLFLFDKTDTLADWTGVGSGIKDQFSSELIEAKLELGRHLFFCLKSFSSFSKECEFMLLTGCSLEEAAVCQVDSTKTALQLSLEYISTQGTRLGKDSTLALKRELLFMLELLPTILSLLLRRSSLENLLTWLETLVVLIQNPLVMNFSTKEGQSDGILYQILLDLLAHFNGEVPKDYKVKIFALLRNLSQNLTPAAAQDPRIRRIFPFEAKSHFPTFNLPPQDATLYPNVLRNVDPIKPWNWEPYLLRDGYVPEHFQIFRPRTIHSFYNPGPGPRASDCTPLINFHQYVSDDKSKPMGLAQSGGSKPLPTVLTPVNPPSATPLPTLPNLSRLNNSNVRNSPNQFLSPAQFPKPNPPFNYPNSKFQ